MACCIFVIGGVIQTAGVVIAMLYVGRLIAGIGVGFLTMIIPIYQAELAHRKIRGKITSLQQLFNAIGQIFATWIGYGCYMTWVSNSKSQLWLREKLTVPAGWHGRQPGMAHTSRLPDHPGFIPGCADLLVPRVTKVQPLLMLIGLSCADIL